MQTSNGLDGGHERIGWAFLGGVYWVGYIQMTKTSG